MTFSSSIFIAMLPPFASVSWNFNDITTKNKGTFYAKWRLNTTFIGLQVVINIKCN